MHPLLLYLQIKRFKFF